MGDEKMRCSMFKSFIVLLIFSGVVLSQVPAIPLPSHPYVIDGTVTALPAVYHIWCNTLREDKFVGEYDCPNNGSYLKILKGNNGTINTMILRGANSTDNGPSISYMISAGDTEFLSKQLAADFYELITSNATIIDDIVKIKNFTNDSLDYTLVRGSGKVYFDRAAALMIKSGDIEHSYNLGSRRIANYNITVTISDRLTSLSLSRIIEGKKSIHKKTIDKK